MDPPGIPALPHSQSVAEHPATAAAAATTATTATCSSASVSVSGSGSGCVTADQLAVDGAEIAVLGLRRRPFPSGQQATVVPPAVVGGSSAAATTTTGAPAPAPAPNNQQSNWIKIDGMLYACIVAVLMGIDLDELEGKWDTVATVVYGITMEVAVCSSVGGFMALCCANPSSSCYDLYRSVSGFCARFGFILCTILLLFYISRSMGRLGWIAGLLFSVVAGGTMIGLWIWAEKKKSVAAEAVREP